MDSNSNIALALRTSASLTFWERLRELGLCEVHIHYDGFNGGGEITEITGVDQKGRDVLPPEIEVLIGSTLVRDLTDLGCELLQTRVPNWSEGGGSTGALILFVDAKKMQFCHTIRTFAILDL
jgi:hypothetical protein